MLVALAGLRLSSQTPCAAGSAAPCRRYSCVWTAVATCSANEKMFFTADEEPKII